MISKLIIGLILVVAMLIIIRACCCGKSKGSCGGHCSSCGNRCTCSEHEEDEGETDNKSQDS